MVEMKTSELIGKPLDWAVAQYVDKHVTIQDIHWRNYCPSADWAVGGPLVESFKIEVFIRDEEWFAYSSNSTTEDFKGPTPLVSAMRCLVASRYGDTISIPKELL